MKRLLLTLLCITAYSVQCRADLLGGTIGSSGGTSATTSNVYFNGISYGTNTVKGAYIVTSTDTVVLASATFSLGAPLVVTLPAASAGLNCSKGSGQIIQIIKVDVDSYPVAIVPNGSDLILGTTQLLTLNAPSQSDFLQADCKSNWWPSGGNGIQITPDWLSPVPAVQTNNFTATTSSDIYVNTLEYAAVPVCITGFVYDLATAGGGIATTSLGVLDRFGNVVASTNSVGANLTGIHTILLPTPACVPPGAYNVAYQPSNTSIVLMGSTEGNAGMWGVSGTAASAAGIVSFSLPGSVTKGQGPGVRVLVAGGRQSYK